MPALARLAENERYLAAELAGRRYDFGVKYGLLTAQLALALSGRDRDEGRHAGETGDSGRNHKSNLADRRAGIVKPTSEQREVNRPAAEHV